MTQCINNLMPISSCNYFSPPSQNQFCERHALKCNACLSLHAPLYVMEEAVAPLVIMKNTIVLKHSTRSPE